MKYLGINIKKLKDCYNENYKPLKNKIKTKENGKISYAHGLEESILGKWLYYQK
jgi:hypothetical protein